MISLIFELLAVTKELQGKEGSISKLPTDEIENLVIKSIKDFLSNKGRLQKYIEDYDVNKQNNFIAAIKSIKDFSDSRIIRAILSKVIVSSKAVEITLCGQNLIKLLECLVNHKKILFEANNQTDMPIVITRKTHITRVHQKGNLLIIDSDDKVVPMHNPYLINAIVKSHYWNHLLVNGHVKNVSEIQKLEGMKDPTYIKNVMKLKFIPAELTEQILNGTQPIEMTVQKLLASYCPSL